MSGLPRWKWKRILPRQRSGAPSSCSRLSLMRSAETAASSGVRVMNPAAFSSSRREGGEKGSRQRTRNWPERLSTVRKSAAERVAARQSAGSKGNVVAAARREAQKKRRRPKLGLGIGSVGFLGGGRGGFFGGFGFGFFGGGFGLGGFRVFFGGFFIAFASVVGDVEAASFEEESSAGADGAFDRALSPRFLRANGFGADSEGFVFHRLKGFEFVAAFAAEIFVCRHNSF